MLAPAAEPPVVNRTAAKSPAAPQPTEAKRPDPEIQGEAYATRLISYIAARNGKFLKNDEGDIFLHLEGREILLSRENVGLSGLMLAVCDVSTVLAAGRIAIQRLLVHAQRAAADTNSRQFSAVSQDEKRIYIPVSGDKLLQISEEKIQTVPNITNEDALWIKHPKGKPFKYVEADAQSGLASFEDLLVETLPCKHDEMRWFLGMHEGLFPLVRDFRTTQFLVVHRGATQQGKTSGAQRFNLLHGLGEVTGDASIPALSVEGDVGLLVLDNREQENLNPVLVDYLLFLATGAVRKRANNDGSRVRSSEPHRPTVVITSIEGMDIKAELRERCVEVEFCVSGQKVGREGTEKAISAERDSILSALVPVLQRFLSIRKQHRKTPNPFGGNFDAHFTALCDLLRAFADVAGKPDAWAEQMIVAWDRIIRQRSDGDDEESELEYHICEVLLRPLPQDVQRKQIKFQGREGTLHVVARCAFLLNELKRSGLLNLPRNPKGFSNRLLSERFRRFAVVREADAPEHKELKRSATCRPVGFFIPGDDMTVNDDAKLATVIGANP
jgi:hypothetical protein